jgi:hypothetical protein
MPAHVLFVDFAALLAAVVGFHMAFRQRHVRRWWRALQDARGAPPPAVRAKRPEDEDPVHYALIIFGMMLLAFALVIGGFVTFYWVFTRGAA